MSRIAVLAVLLAASSARAADLPAGAVARLGDDRFRAGGAVHHLALSPDGKQFVTTRVAGSGLLALTLWDAATGRPLRERVVNNELFKGFVWGKDGARAVVLRAEPGQNGKPAKLFADDFRVWDFADPKAAVPPLLPVQVEEDFVGLVAAERMGSGARYTDFHFSANGKRVAARRESADDKHAVHVFELEPTHTAADLTPAGVIDLGAEGAGAVRLSADGKVVVAFRMLANPHTREWTATAWDVAKGRPAKPVRVPGGWPPPPLTPDGGGVVVHTSTEKEGGYDLIRLSDGGHRQLARSPHAERKDADEPHAVDDEDDPAECMFLPSGLVLVVPGHQTTLVDVKTGKELGRFRGHASAPRAVAVSADGTRIATADRFGLVRLWDAKTFRPLNDAPGHRAPVRGAELSPDGKRLLTHAEDETVQLWDLATGKELRAFGVLGGNWLSQRPTFTPDGTAVVYNSAERLLARDLQTGLEVPLPGGLAQLRTAWVSFAPDGKSVLTWKKRQELEVWDWPSGKKRFVVETEWDDVYEPGFSPDGAAVFADPASGARWDAKTGKALPAAWAKDDLVSRTSGLRPHLRLMVAYPNGSGRPRVIDPVTGKPVPGARLAEYVFDANTDLITGWSGGAFAPDRRQSALSLTRFDRYEVRVHESATGKVRRTLPVAPGDDVRVLGFTPDGTKLLTAGGDHTVLVWDVRLQAVPLPDALKKETNAAKLWDMLATGKADAAYLAMARLSREPDAAIKLAKMKLKPAATSARETDATNLTDARAVELLEALDTADARALLKELAGGAADAFRTQEAKRALERHK